MKLPERYKRKDLVSDVKLNWKFTPYKPWFKNATIFLKALVLIIWFNVEENNATLRHTSALLSLIQIPVCVTQA
jgi:hypothetical protein